MLFRQKDTKLDQFALDIEFLLISVVQGLALSVLATTSIGPISSLDFTSWLYIVSAFLVIIIFWSQAIIHALSFIDWPLDLFHNFLYFLASFVQVLSYSSIANPLHWFAFMTSLFVVAAVLYVVDLRLIKQREAQFRETKKGEALYEHVLIQHLFEMKFLLPSGFLFNIGAVWLILTYPDVFITQHYHLVLIGIQVLFQLGIAWIALRSFKKRAQLIADAL